MVYFPDEIMRHIFEYDNTYHIVYKNVLKQLKKFFVYKQSYLHSHMIHSSINKVPVLNYKLPLNVVNKL